MFDGTRSKRMRGSGGLQSDCGYDILKKLSWGTGLFDTGGIRRTGLTVLVSGQYADRGTDAGSAARQGGWFPGPHGLSIGGCTGFDGDEEAGSAGGCA